MSTSVSAQGSSPRALRAAPLAVLLLVGAVIGGIVVSPVHGPADATILSGSGSSSLASDLSRGGSSAPGELESKESFGIAGGVRGLYPGLNRPITLTVSNPEHFVIVVTSISTKVHNANPRCKAANLSVESFSGRLSVPARGRARTSVRASLARSAPDSCIGSTFPLVYHGLGRESRR